MSDYEQTTEAPCARASSSAGLDTEGLPLQLNALFQMLITVPHAERAVIFL